MVRNRGRSGSDATVAPVTRPEGWVGLRKHCAGAIDLFLPRVCVSQSRFAGPLLGLLDQYFSTFEEIVARHSLEKIKTVGDAYMAVAGTPTASRQHAIDACLAGLEMQASLARTNAQRTKLRLPMLEARVDLHSGPVAHCRCSGSTASGHRTHATRTGGRRMPLSSPSGRGW